MCLVDQMAFFQPKPTRHMLTCRFRDTVSTVYLPELVRYQIAGYMTLIQTTHSYYVRRGINNVKNKHTMDHIWITVVYKS